MRRLIIGTVFLVVLVAGAVGALPFLVSTESVRERIIEKAETLTGRQMSFRAAPKVFFNPYLGIAIDSVIFEGPKRQPDDPPLVEMAQLRGRLAILPALIGRVEITHYQFVRPRFNLRVFEDGHVSWEFPGGRVWQLLELAREKRQATEPNTKVDLSGIPRLALGQFEIIDGVVNYENLASGSRETITNVNTKLIWPNSAAPWSATGTAIWRDEAMDFSMRTSRPLLLMGGGTSATTASIKSGAFQFSFTGEANMLASLHLAGSASLSAPSVARLANLFGGEMEARSTPGPFSASGTINGTPRQIQLTDAEVAIDGNKARGVLQLARNEAGRPQFNATLAFKSFDFTSYLAAFRQEAEINRSELPGLSLIDRFDSDVRISIGEATAGKLAITNLAAALSIRNSELLFDLGNATIFGGTATGMMSVKKSDDGVQFSSEASLAGIQIQAALASLYPDGSIRLNASGNVKLHAKSSGNSARQVTDGLRGWLKLKAGAGTLSGADFNRLRQADSDGEDDSVLRLSGETAFNSLTGDFLFNQGTLWIRGLDLAGDKTDVRLSGRAELASGGLALRARLRGVNAEAGAPETALFIGGVAASPLVTRDRRAVDGAAGD